MTSGISVFHIRADKQRIIRRASDFGGEFVITVAKTHLKTAERLVFRHIYYKLSVFLIESAASNYKLTYFLFDAEFA